MFIALALAAFSTYTDPYAPWPPPEPGPAHMAFARELLDTWKREVNRNDPAQVRARLAGAADVVAEAHGEGSRVTLAFLARLAPEVASKDALAARALCARAAAGAAGLAKDAGGKPGAGQGRRLRQRRR